MSGIYTILLFYYNCVIIIMSRTERFWIALICYQLPTPRSSTFLLKGTRSLALVSEYWVERDRISRWVSTISNLEGRYVVKPGPKTHVHDTLLLFKLGYIKTWLTKPAVHFRSTSAPLFHWGQQRRMGVCGRATSSCVSMGFLSKENPTNKSWIWWPTRPGTVRWCWLCAGNSTTQVCVTWPHIKTSIHIRRLIVPVQKYNLWDWYWRVC